jgi:hypothetical protein
MDEPLANPKVSWHRHEYQYSTIDPKLKVYVSQVRSSKFSTAYARAVTNNGRKGIEGVVILKGGFRATGEEGKQD